ncbi:MAG: HIT domain-containing protein [Burkholderiales bacterium]|nr:HIT domain-containing protein [Burkholderiales bacterium]
MPALLPLVHRESDLCLTIRHPFPTQRTHFVIFPKRDIKDIGSIVSQDSPVLMDCMGHIRWLVQTYQLKNYKVETNGPGRQHVTYLHFHLVSPEPTVERAVDRGNGK